jgi:hypothetical protein
MQYKDGIGKFGDEDNPENSLIISDAYLPDALPNRTHRLPIVRIAPNL